MNYLEKIRQDGISAILARRYHWYRSLLMINNPVVGRFVEITGNRIKIDGMKFSVDSPDVARAHKSTLYFGLHELDERALVKRFLPSHLPAIEFGGGLGVVSCLANRKLDAPERHVVVEAMPAIAGLLEKNRDLNRCQFRIINAALAYGSPTVTFGINESFVGSRVDGEVERTVTVPTITLAQIAQESGFERFSLICDIEGAEQDLIRNESSLIAERVGFALVEIHPNVLGEEGANEVAETFTRLGFRLADRIGWNWAFVKD